MADLDHELGKERGGDVFFLLALPGFLPSMILFTQNKGGWPGPCVMMASGQKMPSIWQSLYLRTSTLQKVEL